MNREIKTEDLKKISFPKEGGVIILLKNGQEVRFPKGAMLGRSTNFSEYTGDGVRVRIFFDEHIYFEDSRSEGAIPGNFGVVETLNSPNSKICYLVKEDQYEKMAVFLEETAQKVRRRIMQ